MLGYKMKSHMELFPPWRRRLQAKIKVAWREVSKLLKLQKGVIKKRYLRSTEALETAKERLTALASHLKRHTRETEARKINKLYFIEPSKVYSQWQRNNITTKAGEGTVLDGHLGEGVTESLHPFQSFMCSFLC